MILYAIKLKYLGQDSNGLQKFIWATKGQLDKISRMRNDEELRTKFVRIGNYIFSPMDIAYIEEKDVDNYGGPIPAYAKQRYLEENEKAGLLPAAE